MKRVVSLILAIMLCLSMCNTNALALSKLQKQRAEKLANICIDNWDKYGVLPSVCIGQAMEETGLGTAYNNGNLWGICSGRVSYSSIESGCIAYLKVINNGYYKGAPFKKDYRVQMRKILNGGYCEPAGSYYSDVTSMIRKYGWDRYDRKLFKKLKKEKQERIRKRKAKKLEKSRKKKQRATFKVVYDSNIPINEAWVSNKVSAQMGTVQIKSIDEMEYFNVYDLKTSKKIGTYEIHVPDKRFNGMKVKLNFNKGAKG